MTREYDTPKYRNNRKALLASKPACHWCGQPATTADHLIEIHAGGTSDMDNLVPACGPCNSRRGSKYQQQQAHAKKKSRENAIFRQTEITPAPINPLFLPNQPEPVAIDSDQPEPAPTGRERPRLELCQVGGNSFGPAVAAWARDVMGVELFPWQVAALSGQLMCDDAGNLLHRESLVSTARQNGKSVALQALIGWATTAWSEQLGRPVTVLSTANQLDRAEAIHTALSPVLIDKFGAKKLEAIGRKSVTMRNGSKWEVRAATTRLHGGSYDLIVVDELWNIPAAVLDEALRPSMIARPNPLLSCWSTAGDANSDGMIRMRERALAELERGEPSDLYFAEWSLPPGVPANNPDYWGYPNPSLGYTITVKALRAAMGNESFARAHLNQWITARGAWLDPGEWDKHRTTIDMPCGGVLAVDSSIDEARYVGVRATAIDGRVMVHVEFVVETEDAMWAEIARVMADKTVTLAVTPSLELHLPVELNRRFTTVGYGELLRYTALVRAMILEDRVIHTGHRSLAEHVNRAVLVKTAQGAVLSSQKSPGPIEIARCAVWAISLVSRPVSKQRPVMAIVK